MGDSVSVSYTHLDVYKRHVDEGGKVTMVTSYDYTMAALVEEAGIDMILVEMCIRDRETTVHTPRK